MARTRANPKSSGVKASGVVHKASPRTWSRIRKLPPRVPVTVEAGLVQALLDRAELAEDARAYDAAKAAGGALIPADVVRRLWNGENAVRVLRQWRALKQGELAKAAKLSQAYVCEIESGKNLSARAAKSLAKALGVDVGDLLT